jgi:GNAT superfamily N-acetyltransferase
MLTENIKLKVGNSSHYISRGVWDRLPADANIYIKEWFGGDEIYSGAHSRSIIARQGKILVGFFRFEFYTNCGGALHAYGTWIDPAFRGTGLATKLWLQAIKKFKPERISVTTTSVGGAALVNSMKTKFPKIYFNHYKA